MALTMSIRKTRFLRSVDQARRFRFENNNWEPPKVAGRDAATAASLVIPTTKAKSPGKVLKKIRVQDKESGGIVFKPTVGVPSSAISSLPARPETQALMRKWAKA